MYIFFFVLLVSGSRLFIHQSVQFLATGVMLPLEEISVVFSITESFLFHSFPWFDFLCLTYNSEQLSGRVSIAVK